MTKPELSSALTPGLRYERISPADLKFTDAEPTWTQPADNIDESIYALLAEEWLGTHIKAELLRLNFQPQERNRQSLGAQLVSEFVNPERIAACLSNLSEDVYSYYLHLHLKQNLEYSFTTVASMDTVFPLPLSSSLASKQILDAGLAIRA